MKPGDPFETEELDQLRSGQRRLLACIDGHDRSTLVEKLQEKPLEGSPEVRPLTEWAVRRVAAAEIAANQVDVDNVIAWRVADVLARLLNVCAPSWPRLPENPFPFQDMLDVTRQQVRERSTAENAFRSSPAFIRIVTLLLWADELAGLT